jgi:signal transduction histidine kinase
MTRDLGRERLAVLVHELRSPVAALSAIAETAGEPGVDASARSEFVRLAVAACRGIERIVADVAVASIRFEEVDPRELVVDAVAAARLRGAPVQSSVADELPPLEGDPARLRQALDNLIANAVTHGAASDVLVTGSATASAVRLSVSDSGRGIPLDDQARIFDAGVRLASDASGMGLGLALARAIVEGHGGSLVVASSPGEGATFTIELPLAATI